jgi:hypothetical protein
MVTKGEIQSIDYQGNTCIVRLPYFESAGIKDNIQAEATINNQPGMYNGYKAGDIVWVAFEDGEASQPVVIGKLYLGANKERNDPRGVVNAESSIISDNIQLPITTKIIYETDGTVAQNGITRYNTLSDITNELGKLSGKQSLTTVDMAGLTTTANQIKAEVSSIKSQTGVKTDYIQDTEPENPNYLEWAPYQQFTSADQYVGFYIDTGSKNYVLITDENKEVWITNPGTQAAFKEQRLAVDNTWLYNGDDLYEKVDQSKLTSAKEFIGCYVYCESNESSYTISKDDPEEKDCPVSKGHGDTKDTKCYKAKDSNHLFVLVSSDNKSKITDATNIAAYKLHLAKNTTFRVASINDNDNKPTWEETTLSTIQGFASSITQTDRSIDAKVSKKYNDGAAADFGWTISQADDSDTTTSAADKNGQFNIYSKITYANKSTATKNVFHANRNGVTITGNLEISDGQEKIFRALPYGDYKVDKDGNAVVNDEGNIEYDGIPQIEIGTQKNIGNENSLWLSPTKGAESPVSIARSMKESDWRITSGNSFGVTKNGSLYSNDITIDGINMNAISNSDNDYCAVDVNFETSNNSFKVILANNIVADRSFLVKIYYKLSDSQSEPYFTEVVFKKSESIAYSTPLIGIDASAITYSWTPQKISLRQGSFLNPSGFFDDQSFSHMCGYRLPLTNNNYQIDSITTSWFYNLTSASAYAIGYCEALVGTTGKPTDNVWGLTACSVKSGDIIYIEWREKIPTFKNITSKQNYIWYYAVFQATKDYTTAQMSQQSYNAVQNEILKFAVEITPSTTSLSSIEQKTYRSNTYIANNDKCVLYIPKEDFSSITSACITTEGNWPNKALPISLAICDIDNDSNTEYSLITVQATALKISGSTIVPYEVSTTTSENISTEGLYANVLCYGVDSFYTAGSILCSLRRMTSTSFTTQLKEITNIAWANLPDTSIDSTYAVTVTLSSNTIAIDADCAFETAGSLIELS